MINKLTAIFVAIATVIMSLTSLFVWGFAPEDETEFTPVIRFVACSDSHLKTAAGVGSHRLEKTAKLAYAIAKADDEYNNLELVLRAAWRKYIQARRALHLCSFAFSSRSACGSLRYSGTSIALSIYLSSGAFIASKHTPTAD